MKLIDKSHILTCLCMLSWIYMMGCKDDIAILNNNIVHFDHFYRVDSVSFETFAPYTLGNPGKIVIQDSVLIIRNRNKSTKFFFYNYNLKNKTFSNGYLRKGRGPSEAIGAWWNGKYKDVLWVFDLTLNKILTIELDNVLNASANHLFNEYPFEKQYFFMDFIDSLTIWANNVFDTRSKISAVNINTGKETYEVGAFGKIPEKVPLEAFKDAYTSYIFAKPSRDKVVLPYRYTDVIEIINVNGNHATIANQGPEGFDVEYKVEKNRGGYYMSKVKETRKAYVDGCVTDRFIYLIYSGHYYDDEHWSNGRYIFIFDWDGHPVKKLVLDRYISIIAVTDDDKVIYSFDPVSGEIIKFDLN